MARIEETQKISRRHFLRLSAAGFTGAALLGVAGCGGGETISGGGQGGGGGAGGGNTFVFGRGADSLTLDPIHATAASRCGSPARSSMAFWTSRPRARTWHPR